jgi:hypothetical protein
MTAEIYFHSYCETINKVKSHLIYQLTNIYNDTDLIFGFRLPEDGQLGRNMY